MMNTKKIFIISSIIPIILFCFYLIFKPAEKYSKQAEKIETSSSEIPITQAKTVTNTPINPVEFNTKNVPVNKIKTKTEQKSNKIKEIKKEEKQNVPTKNIEIEETKTETALKKIPASEQKQKKKNIFSYDISKFAKDTELVAALKLLEEYGDEEVVKNIQKYGMRVKFNDFQNIMYKREAYFAMSAYNQSGTRYILVNSLYKSAPTEQLACVIAHESMHIRKTPTIEEEATATQKEAECWDNLKSLSKTYPDTKLTARLNKLAKLNYKEIENEIAHSTIYREQYTKH